MGKIIDKILFFDKKLHFWAVNHPHKLAEKFFTILTGAGSGFFCLILAYPTIFIIGSPKIKHVIFAVFVAESLGLLIIIITRNFIRRERPRKKLKFLLKLPWNNQSFPSQHGLRSGLLATIWSIHYPMWAPINWTIALLISFSRIYLQWHYLSDVIAGLLLGITCGWIASQNYFIYPF